MRHNQNRRSRGRNNRKGPNPLTRSFESNGPDVKVRGTAAHVAEKYTSLARDAQAAGDIVAVESYLQHAEHYNRIVMAAQAQFQQSQPQYRDGPDEGYDDDRQMNGRGRERFEYNGDSRSGGEEEGEERVEAADEEGDDRGYQPRPSRSDDSFRQRGPRQERYQSRDRQDRGERDRIDGRPERSDRQDEHEDREPVPAANNMRADTVQVQPQPVEPDAGANPPRRRRGRARVDNGGSAVESDEVVTPDGAAALAAFRSES